MNKKRSHYINKALLFAKVKSLEVGFSLVEILIALALSTFIISSTVFIFNQLSTYSSRVELKNDLGLLLDFASSSIKGEILSDQAGNILNGLSAGGSTNTLYAGGNVSDSSSGLVNLYGLSYGPRILQLLNTYNLFSLATVTAKFYSIPKSDFFTENLLIAGRQAGVGISGGENVYGNSYEYVFSGQSISAIDLNTKNSSPFLGNLMAHQGCNPFLPLSKIFERLSLSAVNHSNLSSYNLPIITLPDDQIIISATYDSGGERLGENIGESIWVATQNTATAGSHLYRYSIKRNSNFKSGQVIGIGNGFGGGLGNGLGGGPLIAELIQDISFSNRVTSLAFDVVNGMVAVGLFSAKNQIILLADENRINATSTPSISQNDGVNNENGDEVGATLNSGQFYNYSIIATTSVKSLSDPTPEVRVLAFNYDNSLNKIKLSAGFTKWLGPEYIDFYINNNYDQNGAVVTSINRNKSYEVGSVVNDIYIPNNLSTSSELSKSIYLSTGAQEGVIKLDDLGSGPLEKNSGYVLSGWQTQENTKFFRDGTYLGVGRTVGGFNQLKNPELALWNLFSTSSFVGALKGEFVGISSSLYLSTTTDLGVSVRDVISENTEGALILTGQSGGEIAFVDSYSGKVQRSSLPILKEVQAGQNLNNGASNILINGILYELISASPLSFLCDPTGIFLITSYPPRVLYLNTYEN